MIQPIVIKTNQISLKIDEINAMIRNKASIQDLKTNYVLRKHYEEAVESLGTSIENKTNSDDFTGLQKNFNVRFSKK